MNNYRSVVSLLCVILMLPPVFGQSGVVVNPPPRHGVTENGLINWFSKPYRAADIGPIRLANSNRLEHLLRAGKLYLSMQDAVALAVENNLDVELQRYGPEISKASLLRAQAGGLLRGVPPALQAGPQSAQSQVLGGFTGGAGGGGGGGGGNRGAAGGGSDTGGTIITATGTALPNLDPVFFSSMNLGHTSRPQSNTITTGLPSINFDSNSFTNAIQKGWSTGTTALLSWNMNGFLSNNPLNDLNPSKSGNFQLQISQKLLQGFGSAVNTRNIRIAKNNQKVAELQFQLQLITTVSAIQSLYWDLVSFYADMEVRQKALALAEKLLSDNRKQVEIGTLAPIEIVSAEAEVARRQQEMLSAETALLQQETILKSALSRTGVVSPSLADARVIPTDRIHVPDADTLRPVSDLFEDAMRLRPDLSQTRINLENSQIGLKGSRSQLLPTLDVQANFANNGLAGQPNTVMFPPPRLTPPRAVDPFFIGGYGRVLEQLFRRNFPDYSIGFQLNVPIRNRSAQADMILDTINVRQAELNQQRQINQLRVDVQNAVIAVRQARARHDASVKERFLQEQTLDAEQKKYQLGASTAFFVIRYQRDLAQAQSAEVAARAAYAKAQVELSRVVGETLMVNNIEVVEAMAGQISRPPSALPAEK